MRSRNEGYNTFSNYKNFQGYCDFPKKLFINSFQLSFGAYIQGEAENIESEFRKFRHEIKKFIYLKSKDGYHKERFIFIDKVPDTFVKKAGGSVVVDIFLFTQEDYEKKFLKEHIISLFDGIESICSKHKSLSFIKYKDHAKISSKKKSQEKSSTKER